MMRATDRLVAPSRGSTDTAIAYAERVGSKRLPDVRAFVRETYRLCGLVGIDAAIVVSHSAVETGDPATGAGWTSAIWQQRINPGGIGVTDGPDLGYAFNGGLDAAAGMVAHYVAYAIGRDDFDQNALGLQHRLSTYDPRWDAVPPAWRGSAETVADLQGKWWTNERGTEALVARSRAIYGDLPDQTGAPMPETRIPTIVLDAGHRSTDRSGNPAEMDLTDDLARAYRAELRRRGFETYWYQADLDRDADPDETVGDLNTVAKGLGRWLAGQDWALMLSLHYNGSHSPLHAIVPDNVGLSTAYPEGRDQNDTAANNPLDRNVGGKIMQTMVRRGLGSLFNGKLGAPGLMSETETGVGLQGFRLAVMAATCPSRIKAVRLVIEHGGTGDPAARRFADFARAAADAIESVYGKPATAPTPTTTTTVPPTPTPPDLPAGMSEGVADKLLNPLGLTKPDGGAIGFAATGELGSWWLRRALATIPAGGRWTDGRWPGLIGVTRRGDGRTVHQFGDGAVYEQEA